MTYTLDAIARIFRGSDRDATRALYAELEKKGPAGSIAVNLLRAAKTSERAKLYRGRGYRGAAYDTKNWAIDNLCRLLTGHATTAGLRSWGWAIDPSQPYHRHVLYADLPTGQVSFHGAIRGAGPDYPLPWDGERGVAADRIVRWAAGLLAGDGELHAGGADGQAIAPPPPQSLSPSWQPRRRPARGEEAPAVPQEKLL